MNKVSKLPDIDYTKCVAEAMKLYNKQHKVITKLIKQRTVKQRQEARLYRDTKRIEQRESELCTEREKVFSTLDEAIRKRVLEACIAVGLPLQYGDNGLADNMYPVYVHRWFPRRPRTTVMPKEIELRVIVHLELAELQVEETFKSIVTNEDVDRMVARIVKACNALLGKD